jgi:hypothetical protein
MPLSRFAEARELRRHALRLVEEAIGLTEANLPRLEKLTAGTFTRAPDAFRALLPGAEARLERLHRQRERLLAWEEARLPPPSLGRLSREAVAP